MDITKNIFTLMSEKRFQKKDLAQAIEAANSSITSLEKGERELKVNEFLKIADLFQIRPIDILTYPDIYVKKEEVFNLNEPPPMYRKVNDSDNPWKLLYELQKKYGELEVENERLKNVNAVTPLAAKVG